MVRRAALVMVLSLTACGDGGSTSTAHRSEAPFVVRTKPRGTADSLSGPGAPLRARAPLPHVDPPHEYPRLPAEIASWMPEHPLDPWQGQWDLWFNEAHASSPRHAALEVHGDQAAFYFGKEDRAAAIAVELPCQVEINHWTGDAKVDLRRAAYVLENGEPFVGQGIAGTRRGKAAVVCAFEAIYTLDDAGRCRLWKEDFGRWASAPAVCQWSSEGGQDRLEVRPEGDPAVCDRPFTSCAKLTAEGTSLGDYWFRYYAKKQPTRRSTNFAATRASVLDSFRETDSSEVAKAAGGQIGDLTTVNGIQATYGSDPKLIGQKVTFTARVVGTVSANGNAQYMLADGLPRLLPKYPPVLLCVTDASKGAFTIEDTVQVEGEVYDFGSEAALRHCRVARSN